MVAAGIFFAEAAKILPCRAYLHLPRSQGFSVKRPESFDKNRKIKLTNSAKFAKLAK